MPKRRKPDIHSLREHVDARKDSFDRVIEEWCRERPDLDVTPIGVMGRLRLVGLLVEEFYEASVAPFGIRASDFFLLSELRRAGPPFALSPGDLSTLLVLSTGGITRQLDQLERRSWIRREPDPNDRRGVRVFLTDEGHELIDEALSTHFENEARLLEPFDAREQDRIATLLRELITVISQGTEPLRGRRSTTPQRRTKP